MKQLPYGVQTAREVVAEARIWCVEQRGQCYQIAGAARDQTAGDQSGTWFVTWAGRGIPGHYQWWFATEQQQMLFTLRWS